jgi:NAD(P)-dependent dehydrogenase (short-subunit alcohol dehydrogenase family)
VSKIGLFKPKLAEEVRMTSTISSPSTALVTGATSGIGRATAIALAATGIHVAVSGRDKARGDLTVAAIRDAGGRADFVPADLRDAASATQLAAAAEAVLGHVDILVNNAGSGAFGPTADTTEAAFDELFALNVKAPYFLTAALAPGMAERGTGVIVNVSTMVAEFGLDGMALYGSTKAALELLTKAWSAEFGPKGIRVNAVAPGPVSTEGTEGMREAQGYLASLAPARRLGTVQEIAAAIVYLASPEAAFTHGVVLPVDGGRVAV